MKKIIICLFLIIFSGLLSGQTGEIPQRVQEFQMKNQSFESFQLFSKNNNPQKAEKYKSSATDVTVLELNKPELNRLMKESPEFISVTIPYLNQEIPVLLYKQNILTDTFEVRNQDGLLLDYTPGEYYRGIVSGDYNSIAAVSFYENDIMGVISVQNLGNLNLGKSKDRTDFVVYSDQNLLGQNNFECGFDQLEYNQQQMAKFSYDPSMENMPMVDNCVKIYYEMSNSTYVLHNHNYTSTANWMIAMHNNVATLYSNDGINVALSLILIWTVADPYTGSTAEANLNIFTDTRPTFNADLGHLVKYSSSASGGIAWINSLCGTQNYAYSEVVSTFSQVLTYSWNINVLTHEMGHSMGSRHTHDCVWNGNNTPIDGCGPAAGYPGVNSDGTACSTTGSIPSSTVGGTIMSYCHLTSAGINFVNGFGTQPKTLIKNTISSKSCLETNCTFTYDCSGTPSGGTVTVSPSEGPPNSTYIVSATGYTTGVGIKYQWAYKKNNGSWINVGTPSFQYTDYNATASSVRGDKFQWKLKVTCTKSNITAESAPATFTVGYCDVKFPSGVEPITNVTFAGINKSSNSAINGSPALENFTTITGNVKIGATFQISVQGNTDGNYSNAITVYIDWNRDGVFNTTNEKYYIGSLINSTGTDGKKVTADILIPNNALPGTTRMRVMKKYGIYEAEPCNTSGYGQAEDYSLNVFPQCLNSNQWGVKDAPTFCNPEVTFSTASYAGEYTVMNSAIAGSQYKFSSSVTTDYLTIRRGTFDGPVIGQGITPVTITAPDDGEYFVHINTDIGCGILNAVRITKVKHVGPSGYCPVVSTNTDYGISQVKTTGGYDNFDNITGSGQYTYFSDKIVSQRYGKNINLELNAVQGTNKWGVWVDWNNDNCFNGPAEEMYLSQQSYESSPVTTSFTIPVWVAPGDYRMRVVANWLTTSPKACGNLGDAGPQYGEAEDYIIRVVPDCVNTTEWGIKNAPTLCNPEVILSTISYAGEYATITNATAGSQYMFSSSVATDFITIRSFNYDGDIIAQGYTPITITAPIDGSYYMHINSDSSCGTQNTYRTTKVKYVGPSGYCPVVSNNTAYGISQVKTTGGILNFNNTTGPGQYTYFPSKIVSQIPSGTVKLKLQAVDGWHGWGVWIDWNNNQCFDDPNEVVFLTSEQIPSPVNVTVVVPNNIPLGDYRMRIVANWYAQSPTACGNLGADLFGEAEDYTFRVVSNDYYTITTSSAPAAGGTTSGGGTYSNGSSATVIATPNPGYIFESWQEGGVVVSTSQNYTFTVNGDRTLVAKFKADAGGGTNYTITTSSTPAAGGTTTGAGSYTSGATATVKATANAGYVFESWLEGSTVVATTPKYVFAVSANRTLKAKFVKATYTITTNSTPVAGGTTTGAGSYVSGTNATVKATANAGYVFDSWLEGTTVVATTPKYVFAVSANRTLKAKFVKATYTITTSSTPVAGGTTTGAGSYQSGKNATVKATANAGYVFESWLEGTTVVATTPNFSFTVTGNRTLKAKFLKNGVSFTDGDAGYAATQQKTEPSSNDKIQLYPNPFDDYLMIDLEPGTIIKQIELYDMSGRLIITRSVNENAKYRLDTRNVLKGNYLLVVRTDNGNRKMKVFKK